MCTQHHGCLRLFDWLRIFFICFMAHSTDKEGFRYRHLSLFRYPISKKYLSNQQDSNPRHLFSQPLRWFMNFWMSYIGYRIKVYSDIRYNVGLRSLQFDKFRYQAQSDIADHGYRSKCPPMIITTDSFFIQHSLHIFIFLPRSYTKYSTSLNSPYMFRSGSCILPVFSYRFRFGSCNPPAFPLSTLAP